jgi:RecG-like helicase
MNSRSGPGDAGVRRDIQSDSHTCGKSVIDVANATVMVIEHPTVRLSQLLMARRVRAASTIVCILMSDAPRMIPGQADAMKVCDGFAIAGRGS